jgi:Arc/MetJ family transcription regulator
MPATAEDKVEFIVSSLRDRVETPVEDDILAEVVRADFKRYDSARIKDFVPALVERDVRERLLRRRSTSGA